jgi:hypothetical protein
MRTELFLKKREGKCIPRKIRRKKTVCNIYSFVHVSYTKDHKKCLFTVLLYFIVSYTTSSRTCPLGIQFYFIFLENVRVLNQSTEGAEFVWVSEYQKGEGCGIINQFVFV